MIPSVFHFHSLIETHDREPEADDESDALSSSSLCLF